MKGPTDFFINGKPVRRKRSGAMIMPALPKPRATAQVQPERAELQRVQPKRSIPDQPAESVAAVASVSTVGSPVTQPECEPGPPSPPAAGPWDTVLTALREDQEQRKQEWREQQQEHQERMHSMQQRIKAEVEAALRRVLES